MHFVRRNAQRIVHVPFKAIESSVVNIQGHLEFEDSLSKARKESSGAIGYITSLATLLVSKSARNYTKKMLLPFVAKHLPSVHLRVQKCYALVIVAARLVGFCFLLYSTK